MLQNGDLPTGWLTQVHSVIHILASDENRFTFNGTRDIPRLEEILYGTASWTTDREVLEFYGEDDFKQIEDIFRDRNITVYPIINNESISSFVGSLHSLAQILFSSYMQVDRVGSLPHDTQSKENALVELV